MTMYQLTISGVEQQLHRALNILARKQGVTVDKYALNVLKAGVLEEMAQSATLTEQNADEWVNELRVDQPSLERDEEEDIGVVTARLREKYPWIGMAKNMPPDTSVRAEEILSAEIDSRAGWTTKTASEQ